MYLSVFLNEKKFKLLDIRTNKQVHRSDFRALVKKYSGRKYTNLLLTK